mmetsp:Transcript_15694/g.26273  ORF Transcript_15694/g.26273 Transcript_15694/m.26273 type:complete len:95 (-) Transcript_15694:1219-1503(-)
MRLSKLAPIRVVVARSQTYPASLTCAREVIEPWTQACVSESAALLLCFAVDSQSIVALVLVFGETEVLVTALFDSGSPKEGALQLLAVHSATFQ